MTARRGSELLLSTTGVLMVVSGFAHALAGWPELQSELAGRVDPDGLEVAAIGWHFGSVAMVTFGLLGLLSVARLRRGEVGARWTPVLVGAAYVLFAVGAFAYRGLRVHFLGFLILGLLDLLGGIAWPEKAE